MADETPDIEAMSVPELEEYKLGLRLKIDALRAEMRDAEVVRARKINSTNLAAKLGQDVSHLTEAEVATLLAIANKPKPGDVVAVIGTGSLVAKGNGGDA